MEYDGFEQLVDDDEVFTFLKPTLLTPGATERTHRYLLCQPTRSTITGIIARKTANA